MYKFVRRSTEGRLGRTMKQYQADYSAVIETKEGKTADILVEMSGSGLQIGRFKQYSQRLKGEKT